MSTNTDEQLWTLGLSDAGWQVNRLFFLSREEGFSSLYSYKQNAIQKCWAHATFLKRVRLPAPLDTLRDADVCLYSVRFFQWKKREQKKSTESLTYGKIHPFGREAKWSLLELISPHLLMFNPEIMVHWNSSALTLGIKMLLDNNWKFFPCGSGGGDPFIY